MVVDVLSAKVMHDGIIIAIGKNEEIMNRASESCLTVVEFLV